MRLKVLLFVARSPPSLTLSVSLSLIYWKSLSETKTIQQKAPIFIYYFLQLSYFINRGNFFTLKTDFFGSGAKKTSDSRGLRKPWTLPDRKPEWLTSAWQLQKRQSQEPISSHHKPAGHIPLPGWWILGLHLDSNLGQRGALHWIHKYSWLTLLGYTYSPCHPQIPFIQWVAHILRTLEQGNSRKEEGGHRLGVVRLPSNALLVLRGLTATASRASQRLSSDPEADTATKSHPVIGGLLGNGVLGPSSPPTSHKILNYTSR